MKKIEIVRKCAICASENYYAKGLCRGCYERERTGRGRKVDTAPFEQKVVELAFDIMFTSTVQIDTELVNTALKILTDREEIALRLSLQDGQGARRISQKLNISENEAKSVVNQAKRKIKKSHFVKGLIEFGPLEWVKKEEIKQQAWLYDVPFGHRGDKLDKRRFLGLSETWYEDLLSIAETLSPKRKLIFVMSCIEQKTNHQIACELELSHNYVYDCVRKTAWDLWLEYRRINYKKDTDWRMFLSQTARRAVYNLNCNTLDEAKEKATYDELIKIFAIGDKKAKQIIDELNNLELPSSF